MHEYKGECDDRWILNIIIIKFINERLTKNSNFLINSNTVPIHTDNGKEPFVLFEESDLNVRVSDTCKCNQDQGKSFEIFNAVDNYARISTIGLLYHSLTVLQRGMLMDISDYL